mmetsp:Transcript_35218/g.74998  ORF Transcript_35218/g.74998 Transcript_35218/m.74998 type:complete len:771 (+) Transcript_35218:163-2475(+)
MQNRTGTAQSNPTAAKVSPAPTVGVGGACILSVILLHAVAINCYGSSIPFWPWYLLILFGGYAKEPDPASTRDSLIFLCSSANCTWKVPVMMILIALWSTPKGNSEREKATVMAAPAPAPPTAAQEEARKSEEASAETATTTTTTTAVIEPTMSSHSGAATTAATTAGAGAASAAADAVIVAGAVLHCLLFFYLVMAVLDKERLANLDRLRLDPYYRFLEWLDITGYWVRFMDLLPKAVVLMVIVYIITAVVSGQGEKVRAKAKINCCWALLLVMFELKTGNRAWFQISAGCALMQMVLVLLVGVFEVFRPLFHFLWKAAGWVGWVILVGAGLLILLAQAGGLAFLFLFMWARIAQAECRYRLGRVESSKISFIDFIFLVVASCVPLTLREKVAGMFVHNVRHYFPRRVQRAERTSSIFCCLSAQEQVEETTKKVLRPLEPESASDDEAKANRVFRTEKEILLEAVTCEDRAKSYRAFCRASPDLQADREVVLEAVKRCGVSLQFAHPTLRDDKSVVLVAVKQFGDAFRFASDCLRADKEVALNSCDGSGFLEHAGVDLRADKEVVLKAVSRQGRELMHASKELRADREVVLRAVTAFASNAGINGMPLRFASDELRGDEEVVRAAVANFGASMAWASEELRANKDLVLLAARNLLLGQTVNNCQAVTDDVNFQAAVDCSIAVQGEAAPIVSVRVLPESRPNKYQFEVFFGFSGASFKILELDDDPHFLVQWFAAKRRPFMSICLPICLLVYQYNFQPTLLTYSHTYRIS